MDLARLRRTYGRVPVEHRDWVVTAQEFARFAKNRREPVGAATLIWDAQGRILLVRESGRGTKEAEWATPGGFAAPGEAPEACARREAKEEAGVDLRITGLTKVVVCHVTDGSRTLPFTFVQFEGEVARGRPRPGGGATEARWHDRLPEDLHFRADYVEPWMRGRPRL